MFISHEAQETTIQYKIEVFKSGLKKVLHQPKIKERRIGAVILEKMGKEVFDGYFYKPKQRTTSPFIVRIYSPETQKKIRIALKEIREALIKAFPEEDIAVPFDAAQDEFLKKYEFLEESQCSTKAKLEVKQKDKIKPLWNKKGSFDSKFSADPGILLNRSTEYTCITPSKIESVMLLGYKDKDIVIKLKIKKADFEEVSSIFKKHGFYGSHDNNLTTVLYRMIIQNAKFLEEFLSAVTEAENATCEITNDIIDSVRPFIVEKPYIPDWIVGGSFDYSYYSDSSDYSKKYKQVDYENNSPWSKIKKLTLLIKPEGKSVKPEDKSAVDFYCDLTNKECKETADVLLKKMKDQALKCDCSKIDEIDLARLHVVIHKTEDLLAALCILSAEDSSVSHRLKGVILEAYTPHDCTYSSRVAAIKEAFLASFIDRLGENSPVYILKQNEIGERKIAKEIFSFLFHNIQGASDTKPTKERVATSFFEPRDKKPTEATITNEAKTSDSQPLSVDSQPSSDPENFKAYFSFS